MCRVFYVRSALSHNQMRGIEHTGAVICLRLSILANSGRSPMVYGYATYGLLRIKTVIVPHGLGYLFFNSSRISFLYIMQLITANIRNPMQQFKQPAKPYVSMNTNMGIHPPIKNTPIAIKIRSRSFISYSILSRLVNSICICWHCSYLLFLSSALSMPSFQERNFPPQWNGQYK